MIRTVARGFVLALSLLGAGAALAQDVELSKGSTLEGIFRRGALRVGFEAGYMPFEMIDKRGGLRQRALRPADIRRGGQQVSFIGFDIDIAREMAKELGVRFVPVNTLWTSIIPALNVGRFDIIISGMSITEARKRRVDFAEPYMAIGQTVLLHKKHAGTVVTHTDLDDPKYTVASKPGTTGEAAVNSFLSKATYQPFNTEIDGAMAVLRGEVDAFVYDLPQNAVFYAMHKDEDVVFLDEPFTTEQLAWAVRKDDPEFLKWLNGFLAKIKTDGRYQRIYTKWFKRIHWHQYVR